MTESELLFTHLLKCDRLSLYLDHRRMISDQEAAFLASALRRRTAGDPLQYILGVTEFMGFDFAVKPSVFIPRPETEILVETVIGYAAGRPSSAFDGAGAGFARRLKGPGLEILDVGTGSGCIAVSLAKMLKRRSITAVDISKDALEIARRNAKRHNVENEIHFIEVDFFNLRPSAFGLRPHCCDMIVSNPPYIPTGQIDNLQAEVRKEPRIALDGGKDGLDFYRRFFKQAPRFLRKRGLAIVEIGCGQLDGIRNLLQNTVSFEIIEVVKDYSGIDRVVVIGNRQSGY